MKLYLGIASKGVGNSVFTAFFYLSFFFAEPCFITFIIKKRKEKGNKQKTAVYITAVPWLGYKPTDSEESGW